MTELIVPAHAFSPDSIIRHSGHPEKKKKKNEGGKKVMWAESVGEWKWKGEKRKKGFEKDVDKRGESWERVEKMEDES